MHKFPIANYKRFAELPLDELDSQKFAIYFVDTEWNYLFANKLGCENLSESLDNLIGRSMFSGIDVDLQYKLFLEKIERGTSSTIITISPTTMKRVSVIGYPLQDCYYFAVTILPDKESLLDELRSELRK
jgi:hypothetical protein